MTPPRSDSEERSRAAGEEPQTPRSRLGDFPVIAEESPSVSVAEVAGLQEVAVGLELLGGA